MKQNRMKLEFAAISENEGLARIAVAAFITSLNPTLEEMNDVKTAVSEAVTNAIIHGYDMNVTNMNNLEEFTEKGMVRIYCKLKKDTLQLTIEDDGKGIENIAKAMEPLYTTKPELDRSGMGFAFMEAFMDDVQVYSQVGKGTRVFMQKKIGVLPYIDIDTKNMISSEKCRI